MGLSRRAFLMAGGAAATSLLLPKAGFSMPDDMDRDTDLPGVVLPKGYKHPTLASDSTEPVGVSLICLFDSSSSIDTRELEIELGAMAEAFRSEEIKGALFGEGGPESMAVCVADFGSRTRMRIPWLDVRKGEAWKLDALAGEIERLPRRELGNTYETTALQYCLQFMNHLPWEAKRSVVDVITDPTQRKSCTQRRNESWRLNVSSWMT